jgi:hypothetical protein
LYFREHVRSERYIGYTDGLGESLTDGCGVNIIEEGKKYGVGKYANRWFKDYRRYCEVIMGSNK